MADQRGDDFYVGYEPTAPAGIARHVWRTVFSLIVLAILLAGLLVWAQSPFSHADFEFGTVRSFEGIVRVSPHPVLEVARPGTPASGVPPVSRYLLVGFGKHGATADVAAFDGQRVHLDGTLIHRRGRTMIEIADIEANPASGSPAFESPAAGSQAVERVGPFTLAGEIVDSTCFLGVMKPGSQTVHRACAIRCLSGGIPPLFVVRDGTGPAAMMLLVDPQGAPLGRDLLDRVAVPVSVRGEVVRVGDRWQMRAGLEDIRRLE